MVEKIHIAEPSTIVVNGDQNNDDDNKDRSWFHRCWCCYAVVLLLLLIASLLSAYFLESLLSQAYSFFHTPFGKENFNIIVLQDERYVRLCVRDFGCEDGDRVRVSVNSDVIFSGEIYSAPVCKEKVKVNEGSNTVELYAINGTGGKGNCPNNINTGEVTIHGENTESQSWHQPAKQNESAILEITIE